jgi:inosine-uridine nucleoside N-ribohydrolase
MPLPILLDTDPGVDDALALKLALRSPELELLAVTTVAGNVGLEATTRNALLLLDLFGRADIPVHAGGTPPPHRASVTAADVHGGDGLGGITSLKGSTGRPLYPHGQNQVRSTPAVDAILQHARDRPGEITVVAVGPLTNLARAVEEDSDTLRGLREIVCMGGAFRCPGNITPVAEFNIFVDPEAAQTVLDSGIPIRFVPLDVTERVLIYPSDLQPGAVPVEPPAAPVINESAPAANPQPENVASSLLTDLLQHTFGFYEERAGYAACHLHDPLAVAALLWPELYRFQEVFVEVETSGEVALGMTVADLRERRDPPAPNCAFAADVDVKTVRERILARLLA